MTANTDRIARNIQSMEDADVSPEEIEQYIADEKADPRWESKVATEENLPEASLLRQNSTYQRGRRASGGKTIPASDIAKFGQQALQGATFNLADEAQGGIASTYARIYGMLAGDSEITGKRLDQEVPTNAGAATASIREQDADFVERNPNAALIANVAGGIATPGLATAKVFNKLRTAPKLLQRAAVPAAGGAQGGLYGFGTGEGQEDSIDKAKTGATIGAIAAPLIQYGGKYLANKATQAKAKDFQQKRNPTMDLEDLRDEAKKFYDKAENSNIRLTTDATNKFKNTMEDYFDSEAIRVGGYGPATGAINKIDALKNPTYKELEAIQISLRKGRISGDPSTKKVANEITEYVDDLMNNLKPSDIVSGSTVGLKANLERAKDLWHRKGQVEAIDEMQETALLSETVIDANDFDKAIRGGVRSLLGKSRRTGQFDDVKKEMEAIITGGFGKRLARLFGGMTPGSHTARGTLPTAIAATAGYTAGGAGAAALAMAAPAIVGGGFKQLAGVATNRELAAIKQQILNKNQKKLYDILERLTKKYQIGIGTAAVVGAGQAADKSTTLQDMIP